MIIEYSCQTKRKELPQTGTPEIFSDIKSQEISANADQVIKLFSCSTQLSTKFQLLIKTKIPTNEEVSCLKSLRCCHYHAYKCKKANNCWHFNIYELDIFHAQLS